MIILITKIGFVLLRVWGLGANTGTGLVPQPTPEACAPSGGLHSLSVASTPPQTPLIVH